MAYDGNSSAALSSIRTREITKAMQSLMGICSGLAADRNINEQEVRFLNSYRELSRVEARLVVIAFRRTPQGHNVKAGDRCIIDTTIGAF